MICYPAHTTHIYQGLDVVVFGPLKATYGKGRDQLLRDTGEHISKENFLAVYGNAHLTTLQPCLIKTAFSATGLVPFNRDAISKDKFAPSRDTSFRHISPVEPSTPVRIITDLLIDTIQPSPNNSNNTHENIHDLRPLRRAVPELTATDARFLVSESPIKASMQPPHILPIQLSPAKCLKRPSTKTQLQTLISTLTSTRLEKDLQVALVAKAEEVAILRSKVLQLQSAMILQRVYCARVRRQLNAKETKANKGKRGGRILADGESKLLTGSAVFGLIEDYEVEQERVGQLQVARRKAKADHLQALQEWTKIDEERKKRNEMADLVWKKDLEEWTEKRKQVKEARQEKLKDWELTHPKPKQKDYHIQGVPKPKMKKTDELDLDNSEDDDLGWEDETDGEE